MEKYLELIKENALFDNIKEKDLLSLLACVRAKKKEFPKDALIILAGNEVREIGLILEGRGQIVEEDYHGHRNILTHLAPGDVFGEVFACAGVKSSPVSVVAETPVKALFLDFQRISNVCESACRFHSQLINNMLKVLAQKNIENNRKISCLGSRSIRSKVEIFLSSHMRKAGANPFLIPYSRADMADYLCVDRSALSFVLGEMRDAGLINFQKNKFELLPGFWDQE